ncbi:MAG: hypothetical protein ABSG14_07615 [Verrucomicrobiia bacterium]|jgi:NADH dehydrogenase/NADH:ubiquinone oxidoreductase subunit G
MADPITGLNLFDRWLTEHGNAVLSAEMTKYLRQKIADLQEDHAREVAKLKAEQQQSNTEHAKEIAHLNQIHAEEMSKLEGAIAELQNPKPVAKPKVTEGEESLIRLMVAVGGTASVEGMARKLAVALAKAQYFANNLERRGFAKVASFNYLTGETNLGLTPAGNAYAVENGLADDVPPPAPTSGPRRG